jgi:DNA sulfur modification protein DndB
MTAGEVRADFIHSHGIGLAAMGRVGNTMLHQSQDAADWATAIKRIGTMDWTRANTRLWEGRAMIGGRVSKSSTNVILTTNALRTHLGMPLSPEEQRIEDAYLRGTS